MKMWHCSCDRVGHVIQKEKLVGLPQHLVVHKVGGRHLQLQHEIVITGVNIYNFCRCLELKSSVYFIFESCICIFSPNIFCGSLPY